MMIRLTLALFALLACQSTARATPLVGDADMHEVAASLRPGQFHWDQDDAVDAPVTISVSTVLQRIYVYRGDVLVGVASVSTGRPGHTTPNGEYSVLQKRPWHRSNLYSNAPMPFMQRLTWTGIALHAGANPGYPASHGCVRLPPAFARALFAITRLGAPVTIADYPTQLPVWLDVGAFEADAFDRPDAARLDYASEAMF